MRHNRLPIMQRKRSILKHEALLVSNEHDISCSLVDGPSKCIQSISSPPHETGNQIEDECFHADASRAFPTNCRVKGARTRNSSSFSYLRLICDIARSCRGC